MKKLLILFFILLLASFLRFYQLNNIPPSASLDEVSIGYNAYSILKTGGDEYGYKFPLLLRAYDDWRPALYVYLVIPFVQLFGLSALAVRLPSVILSILTIIAVYFLVKELFLEHESTQFKKRINTNSLALTASFLLAISPWHIYMSRLGHEVNAGISFFIFGLLFFLKWISSEKYSNKKETLILIFSTISFSLSFVSYQSEKVFLPFIVLGLLLIYRNKILQRKKQILTAGIIALVILTPFIKATFEPNALIRFKATNIVDANKERFEKQAFRLAKAAEENNLLDKVIYNRRVLTAQIAAENYIAHLNPFWLFSNSSSDRHKVPDLGLLYLWELPLIILGVIFFVFKKFNNDIKKLILVWVLSAPLAGAITSDAPHAMRSFTILPTFQIFAAVGLFFILNSIKNNLFQKIFIVFFIFLSILSIGYLYKQYFFVFPKTQSASFQYALSKAISFVLEHEKKYNKIIFSNQDNLYQSYMFFLFYSKYDPILYQKQGGTKSGGFAEDHKFGKYEFRSIDWQDEKKDGNILYVGNFYDFSNNNNSVFESADLNEKINIKIVK